ncbi:MULTISPECIES: winged helix-turn-helix domain-containing protein [Dethiosulfovibrio]|jgi:DNA-binding transcriptional ArsR family regulator|uniref:Winged helix-turn-helix domain-containing protein n=2 Tax=Dethiosulfovibrio TaxID=47054 RepID=A0ABS9EPU5_9BACT|nr:MULTISPECIES: winged helix-turn-helix domain-containing protein [Dethiosulfovibrio]MCF4114822.1 winged helix-turn-helix domain-containing protein [Dethiosulfovibrio russensis]MCF4143219.1 winged helix-turn-helix domain-containing protein [Dethiosulfovibrio marinus]MCF4145327.1 winged helix-turn-helix domain-containing protein [Dethiosulfovibrio acidaminovorans]
MLESLITSKTRVRLLLKLFLNPGSSGYLRELADEFGESTNSVRVELNRLAEAGLLESSTEGRTKVYRANSGHPLFPEIQGLVRKTMGIDRLVESVVAKLGDVKLAFVTGDYARGVNSGLMDLVLVGSIDREYLQGLVSRLESDLGIKIRWLVLDDDEFERLKVTFEGQDALVIWKREENRS